MTRRMMMLMTAGAIALGFAGLAGFASNNAFSADDEDASQEALIKLLDTAKINLQQGLAASEQQGKPISANSRLMTASFSFRSTPRRKASFSKC
jgi:hypothetical protein